MGKTRWHSVLAISLVGVLLLGTSHQSAASSQAPTAKRTPAVAHYSGEAIYRGLFWGEGDVAQLVGGRTVTLSPGLADVRDTLIGVIKTDDPGFFDRFGIVMQSGNRPKIDRTITDTWNVTSTALSSQYGVKAAPPPGPDCIFVFTALAIALVVVAFGLATLSTAVMATTALAVASFLTTAPVRASATPLTRDALVNKLAITLRG